MTEDISPDEKTIVDEILRRIRANERQPMPSHKVKQFLWIIGDELKRTGDRKKEYVDRLVDKFRSGERRLP